jgi:hypothetical protein
MLPEETKVFVDETEADAAGNKFTAINTESNNTISKLLWKDRVANNLYLKSQDSVYKS